MIDWTIDLFAASLLALSAGALLLARPRPGSPDRVRAVGVVSGGLALLFALVNLALPGGEILGPASILAVPLTLVVPSAFLVSPRRELAAMQAAHLLLSVAAHLALAATPRGPVAAVLWVIASGLLLFALPAGPVRRIASLYLAASAICGATGELIEAHWSGALLLLAAALRLGIPPFQSWVVEAWRRGPVTWVAAALAPTSGLALLARDASIPSPELVDVWLVAASLLAGAVALVSRTLPSAMGWLSIAVQCGVLAGIIDPDPIGHQGGILAWAAGSIALLGFGAAGGLLVARVGEVSTDRYLGLSSGAPALSLAFVVLALASVGAPGTLDFVASDLVLHGSLADSEVLLILYVASIGVQAYVALALYYRIFLGPPTQQIPDLLPRERYGLVTIAALLVLLGLVPQWAATEVSDVNAPAETTSRASH